MRIDANDNAQVEADLQFRMFDVSDDELERAANDHQQAATWSMMPTLVDLPCLGPGRREARGAASIAVGATVFVVSRAFWRLL
jgi:hypothetical protein